MDQLMGINHFRLKSGFVRVLKRKSRGEISVCAFQMRFMGFISVMHCTENEKWPEFSLGHRLTYCSYIKRNLVASHMTQAGCNVDLADIRKSNHTSHRDVTGQDS